MNKRVTIAISAMLILAAAVQISFIVDSFPGFHSSSDCALCHNEPATAWNASYVDSSITLDGMATESFWGDSNTHNTMEYPMATTFGSTHIYLQVKFSQNATHLFVRMQWEDPLVNGTDTLFGEKADGVAILWNMQPGVYEMKDGWFGGMKTDHANESVDLWMWRPAASDQGAETTVNTTATEHATITGGIKDTMFSNTGIDNSNDTSQDVSYGSSWGYMDSHATSDYGVEFARPLVTNDAGDVQFDKIGYYDFAIALWNGTSGGNHIMSFEHHVWVYGECSSNCDIPQYITAGTIVGTATHYVPTTATVDNSKNVTITETSTKSSSPVNFVVVLTTMMSFAVIVQLVKRRKT